ncbi:hypothetical protein [Sorangium sp. So ce233]|uniref:hypothetical protein n=1 Tax=Sorangium sp. So ce233 TaxID=3133290 RepID=UPI003F5F0133
MREEQRVWGALLLVVAQVSLVAACSMTIEDSGGGADTGTGTGASTSSGGPGGGAPAPSGGPGGGEPAPSGGPDGGAPETAVDLFACGLEPSCDQLRWYIDVQPMAAFECAARLVLSGGTGVITAVDAADGFIDETETLVVVLGDGTGLVQTRERQCCYDVEECDPEPPWEAPSRHQLCDLEVPSPVKEACEQNLVNQCSWTPWDLTNCRDVEDYTCEDIARRL